VASAGQCATWLASVAWGSTRGHRSRRVGPGEGEVARLWVTSQVGLREATRVKYPGRPFEHAGALARPSHCCSDGRRPSFTEMKLFYRLNILHAISLR